MGPGHNKATASPEPAPQRERSNRGERARKQPRRLIENAAYNRVAIRLNKTQPTQLFAKVTSHERGSLRFPDPERCAKCAVAV